MKINVLTDENNIIVSWTDYPFDKKKPTLEIDNPCSIRIGFDKFENGELIRNEEGYQADLEMKRKYSEIRILKDHLCETDYKLFKYLEGELSEDDYFAIKTQRQEWRNRINQLEEELANGISKSN